ncbi:D-aminoacyl-tRNA deacylase [Candidatus Norongarragalina meridionalis]|nr:D-aminoacyl-tRNA deacylase [Candidatus Norongarragalina meridionalis]
MPIVFYGKDDAAGRNIVSKIRGAEIRELPVHPIRADLSAFTSDLFVFASTHRSESGKPCLTVHPPGNWGTAEMGGNEREVQPTSAFAIKAAFLYLKAHPVPGFDVFMEATHHGPGNLNAPCFFIEIGSSEKEWGNEEAGVAVAGAIEAVLAGWKKPAGKVALGFGGTHYCPSFSKMEAEGYAFSHICPKYALDKLDADMLAQAVAKTAEKVECGVMDDCRGEQKRKVALLLEQAGIPLEKL